MCLRGGNWRTGQLNSSDTPDAPHAASEIHPGLSAVLFLRPGIQPDWVLIEEILVAVETSWSCGRCVNSLAVVKLLSYQEAFPEVIPPPASSCPQQTGLCCPLCWCSRSSWCSHFFFLMALGQCWAWARSYYFPIQCTEHLGLSSKSFY